MSTTKNRPSDDPSSAPESGTVRDETSGNQPANPQDRPPQKDATPRQAKDDPGVAGEEK